LYQIKTILNNKQKKIIYDAWIGSILRYGTEIYGHASEYLINRLQKIQNKLIKILFGNGKKYKTHILFKKNRIMNIKEIKDFAILSKYYFNNKYKNYTSCHSRIRGGNRKFRLPQWRNQYGKRRREWYIPEIFNDVSENMLKLTSIMEFKREFTNNIFKETT